MCLGPCPQPLSRCPRERMSHQLLFQFRNAAAIHPPGTTGTSHVLYTNTEYKTDVHNHQLHASTDQVDLP
jgi:hypothetical protein